MGTLHTSTCQHGDSHKMSERRKSATKKLEKLSMNPKTPMTKEQKEVTDWLKCNVPTKWTYLCLAVSGALHIGRVHRIHRIHRIQKDWCLIQGNSVSSIWIHCLGTRCFIEQRKFQLQRKKRKEKRKNVNNEEKEDKTDTDIDKFSETGEDEKVEKPE